MQLPALLRRSLRAKITALVVTTTLTALALSAVVLVYYAMRDYRQTHLLDIRTQADILARASAAALAFNDHREALQNLQVLQARPDIQQAALYGVDGSLFAAYSRDSRSTPPATAAAFGHLMDGDRLTLFQPVEERGQQLGTVYIESTHKLAEHLIAYALIVGVVMALAGATALLLSAWLQRFVTEPILGVSRAANAVVESRDFSVRATGTSDDEIGALAVAFNRMLEEIDKRTQELVESEQRFRTIADSAPVLMWLNGVDGSLFVNRAYLDYVGAGSQDDVRGYDWLQFVHPDDREAYVGGWLQCLQARTTFDSEFRFLRHDGMYRWMRSVAVPRLSVSGDYLGHTGCTFDVHEGRIATESLQEADRRKDEFLATLAHELRNPLAPIRAAVQMMAIDEEVGRRPKVREMLHRQVEHMVRLVDDLLEVSRFSRGVIRLERELLDVSRLLRVAVETAQPLFDDASQRLTVTLGDEPLVVFGDAVRLSQVFANVLNNAAKYTDDGGHIDLWAGRDGRDVVVRVRDNGIGLDAEDISRLFGIFAQIDAGAGRARGGLGIGLALVKRLVELHGGTVHVDSDGRGAGSCFTVRLPLAEERLDDAEPSPPDGLSNCLARRRLLIVDDNRDAADSLAMLLRMQGAEVEVAHDGATALKAYERFLPHAVLLDLGMPGMDGFEVAAALRARDDAENLTLIALTGWGQSSDRDRTRAAGFDHHLVKPADPAALQQLLGSATSVSS